jgi:hypothetical protein
MNVCAGEHQRTDSRLLIFEGEARRGQGHQRRGAARQQDDEDLGFLHRRGNGERARRCGNAAGIGKWMSGGVPLDLRRQIRAAMRTDREDRPHMALRVRVVFRDDGRGHGARGFSDRDDMKRLFEEFAQGASAKRTGNCVTRIDAVDRRADDRQQI